MTAARSRRPYYGLLTAYLVSGIGTAIGATEVRGVDLDTD